MYERSAIRSCLGVFLALASTSACDMEPAGAPDILSEPSALRSRDTVESTVMASARSDASTRVEFDSSQQIATHDASAESLPSAGAASFPVPQCRQGYTQRGDRLCISNLHSGSNYMNASSRCRNAYGHVCTYEDLTYLYLNTGADASYNPSNRWIGPMAGDNHAYCGNEEITSNNDSDRWDFEDICEKNDFRRYWCCHDRE